MYSPSSSSSLQPRLSIFCVYPTSRSRSAPAKVVARELAELLAAALPQPLKDDHDEQYYREASLSEYSTARL
jgi:hypothetical protein